jgi:hypothetical protein
MVFGVGIVFALEPAPPQIVTLTVGVYVYMCIPSLGVYVYMCIPSLGVYGYFPNYSISYILLVWCC